jgi:flagellar protein FlaI
MSITRKKIEFRMMNINKYLDLEMLVLQKLEGRMSLMLTDGERESLVKAALEEALKDEGKAFDEFVGENKNIFIKKFLSYGIIEDLLHNAEVEDIIINALKPIYVHHGQKGLIVTDKSFQIQKEFNNFILKLLIFSGRKKYHKIANLELANLAGRVNIVDSPLGTQLTISKAKMDPLSIIDLIRRGTMSYEAAGQLWIYLEGLSIRPANIIISGGPGTGKTTLLNALFSFIPGKDRLVVIEDTLELNTFMEDSCSRLETDDELSLSDLVKNSLRMRPERIIVGEVRGSEARDMITAVNIGKYCMGTMHALSARETITRLHNEPMNVPDPLINLIDVFIILKRYHVKGKLYRVIDEVSETSGMEASKVLLSQVFKYNYDQNYVVSVSPSTVYRDRLALETGLTPRDVINETWIRAAILKTLDNRDIHTIKEVSTFCRYYALNPKEAMVKIGLDRERMLKDLGK